MKKRILVLLLSLVTASAALAGCGTSTNSAGTQTAPDFADQGSDRKESSHTVMGEIKSIDGNTLTLLVNHSAGHDGPGDNMGAPPAASENEMGEPPSGSDHDMAQPPTMSDNNREQPPAMPDHDMEQTSGNQEMEITVTDDTSFSIEQQQDTQDASLSDLSEGTMIKVTLNQDETTASSIHILPNAPKNTDDTAENIPLDGAQTIDGKKVTSSDESFSSSADDENVILVTNQGNLKMAGASLTKSGDTSSEEYSNFYGQNAVLAVTSGSKAELTNVEITASGEGSNAIFATGENASIHVDTAKIHTKGHSSRGLDATYGGTITASNVDISTEGAHCAALATDRGEGTVDVTGATLSTQGEGSPCIYSTGEIIVRDASGSASGAQTLVVEGKNSVDLTNCRLKGAGDNGLMLYQSTSGDARTGTAVLSATDSKLTTTSSGPMIYVTNTDAQVTLTGTRLKFPGNTLINAAGNTENNWGTPGENGGNLTLTGIQQTLEGNISCDAISTVHLILSENSVFTGAMNPERTGKSTSVQLDESSVWNVTEDSCVTFLSNTLQDCSNIQSNGHTIYYDSSHPDSEWLKNQTLNLPGGGLLVPLP